MENRVTIGGLRITATGTWASSTPTEEGILKQNTDTTSLFCSTSYLQVQYIAPIIKELMPC